MKYLDVCNINHLLICGYEDGAISFWDIHNLISSTNEMQFPKFSIYLQSKINTMALDSILGVVIAIDDVNFEILLFLF